MGITFKEINDNCDICPLKEANICHGVACYGGEPVLPPCAEMDENTDAEAYVRKTFEYERRMNEQREEKLRLEAEKKEKSRLQSIRTRFINSYCHEEMTKVKELKRLISAIEKNIKDVKCDQIFAETMEKGGVPVGNTDAIHDALIYYNAKLVEAQEALEKAKAELTQKRKEAKKTEEYKNIA